jgi:hypothetical protein
LKKRLKNKQLTHLSFLLLWGRVLGSKKILSLYSKDNGKNRHEDLIKG